MKTIILIIFLIFSYYSNHSFAKKGAKACEWIFNDGLYQEYLDVLPLSDFHSAFYLVVGKVGTKKSGVCTYGYRWDIDRPLIDVKREAKGNCDKYKRQFNIEGECRPYDINKEIVWNEKLLKKWIVWNKKLEKKFEELKVIEKAIQIPNEVSERFIIMHNTAFDENRKTFFYDNGETYLVGSEKIDIKDAVVTVKPVHYCKKESSYVFQTNKPCKLLSQTSEKLVEVYLTPDQFLALKDKNEKIKKETQSKITKDQNRNIKLKHNLINKFLGFNNKINFIIPEDNKEGRSLIDRPDTNDDYKIHFMYILPKESKDREMDINGKLEKMVFGMDDLFFKLTSNTKKNKAKGKDQGHRLKLDFTEENRVDVTFVRLPWTTKELYTVCKEFYYYYYNEIGCTHIVDFITYYLGQKDLFQRKKIYSILFDIYEFGTGEGYWGHANIHDPGVGYPVPWGYTYYKGCASKGKKVCERVMLHELIHSFGFTKACHQFSKKDESAHLTKRSDLMYYNGSGKTIDKNNESYYLHGNSKCRDLADVIYLTPTSPNAFDPSIWGFN